MNLSNLLGIPNQNASSGASAAYHTASQANTGQFKAGQSVRGEVVSIKGNEVTLALEDGTQINAKLDRNMQIDIGQSMTFEVKSNTGARLALTPLYENMGNDPNILKALAAAGMGSTAKNIAMVSALMREGLPVDRNSLLNFGRQMAMTEVGNPVTLAQMNRLQIPVTPENIVQFEAYQNLEHQISQSLLEIADGLTDTLSQMVQSGDYQGAAALYKQVLSFLTESELTALTDQVLSGTEGLTEGNTPPLQSVVPGQEAYGVNPNGSPGPLSTDLSGVLPEVPGGAASQAVMGGGGSTDSAAEALGEQQAAPGEGSLANAAVSNTASSLSLMEMAGENRLLFADLLRTAGFSEGLANAVISGTATQAEVLRMIAGELAMTPEAFDDRTLAQVFNSKEYGVLLKNEMSRQWLLEPEQVAGDRQVAELYNRLQEHTAKLTDALTQAAKADTPVAQAAANLTNNLNFVNQLNQMFTYIQLPLKMNGENTHGELYVYTNKKNLAKNDGNVSALLHLDMEHLGPVDVYVALQDQKVSTKFYLRDDATLDLVASHVDMLNERLKKRGYAMECEFIPGERAGRVPLDDMLDQDKSVPLLANYSFDARA